MIWTNIFLSYMVYIGKDMLIKIRFSFLFVGKTSFPVNSGDIFSKKKKRNILIGKKFGFGDGLTTRLTPVR